MSISPSSPPGSAGAAACASVRSHRQIIADAGGPLLLARRVGATEETVRQWEARWIPERWWDRLSMLGHAAGRDELAAGLGEARAAWAARPSRLRLEGLGPGVRSHRQIIAGAGGVSALARRLGLTKSAVSRWAKTGVPEAWWDRLADLGLASGRAELAAGVEPRAEPALPPLPSLPPAGAALPPAPAPRPRRAAPAAVSPVSEAEVAAVRARRGGFLAFCRGVDIPGAGRAGEAALAAHQRLWIEKLEAVERGEITRLMGFMPPGAAKSTFAVDLFMPWFLGRAGDRSGLLVTYSTAQARRRGRRARYVAMQGRAEALLGTAVSVGRKGSVDWALDNGSDWMGAGMLAGITGNRADLIVIDDPVKGRAEADSAAVRRRTREEFDDTVRTRLKPGGRMVLIQTRWHEDDLAGSLLPAGYDGRSGPVLCRDGEVWEVVNLPAEAERDDDPLGRAKGEMLWPEYWPAGHWAAYRLNVRTWNALYQQRPAPDEGSYFERRWFQRFTDYEEPVPELLRYFGTSDYAVSEGRGDWTRLTVWGLDGAGRVWRVAGWGGRTSADVWIEQQLDLTAEFRRHGAGIRCWYGEAGTIQLAVEPMLKARMRERRISCRMEWLPSIGDKTARARAAQALVRQGRVLVREDGDGDCFIDECVAFPAGRHDDEVDCLSLMGRALPMVGRGGGRRAGIEMADLGRVFD